MVDDLIFNTKEIIKKNNISSCDQILNFNKNIVCFSDDIKDQELKLKSFLKKNMYEHARVKRMTIKAKKLLQIFLNYLLRNQVCFLLNGVNLKIKIKS